MVRCATGVAAVQLCLAICAFFAPSLSAQTTGSISGTVTDAAGGSAPNANITVTAPATGLSRSARTDKQGGYLVPLLGVGVYDIKVELPGFQTAEAKDISLQVDEHRELDFKLSPATVHRWSMGSRSIPGWVLEALVVILENGQRDLERRAAMEAGALQTFRLQQAGWKSASGVSLRGTCCWLCAPRSTRWVACVLQKTLMRDSIKAAC